MALPLPQPTNVDELAWRERIRRALPTENRPGWQEGRSLEWIRARTELGFATEWVVARMVEVGELTEIVSGDKRFYRIIPGATLGLVPPAYPGLDPGNAGQVLVWDGTSVAPSGDYATIAALDSVRNLVPREGEEGEQGPVGRPGDAGPQGADGQQGPRGTPGEDGDDGWAGRPGDVGPQGIQGPQGDQGIQGVEGQVGLRGFSGEDGEDGMTGRPGDMGPQGLQGEPGANGIQGATGATGATGDRGLRGLDGEDGEDGFPGRPGEVGPQGPQGIRGWAEEYVQDDPIPRRVGSAGLREIGLGADDLSTNGTNVAAFAAIAHTHPIMGWRMPAVWPGTANITTSTTVATTTTRALYLGKAHKAITSVTVIYSVTVAAATITWAEVACATGTFVAVGSPTLTNRGYTNVAAVVNTTGIKTTSITTTGIAEGDDLWLLWGNQATTAMQLRCSSNVDDLWTGGAATATARPSTMGAQLFTGGNENIIWCLALFA